MSPLKTILIGLGQIGALNDLHVKHEQPLSHLSALLQNDRFEIAALVDLDVNKTQQIQGTNKPSSEICFNDTGDIRNKSADIVIIATPPHDRINLLNQIIKLSPQLIVFEKPLALTSDEALKIRDICQKNSIKALVNFHRRYDGDHITFKSYLPSTPPEKIIFHYSKGLWNYGSHGIDLIQNWFGHISEARGFNLTPNTDDYVDGILKLKSGTIVHLISHKTEYDLFEFEFFYDSQIFTLRDGGINKTKQGIIKNLHHQGYSHLGPEENIIPPSKVYGLQNLYADIAKVCENPTYRLQGCSLDEAISGIKTIETLIKTVQDTKKP
jgi:predicted dehydrogenase